MRTKFNYYWLLLLAPAALLAWYFVRADHGPPLRELPVYGPKGSDDAKSHRVPPFRFRNQYGEVVSEKTVAGKVYVAEFFFTTCRTICPVMNANLDRIYSEFKNDSTFLILSHTVDPETDSIPQLRKYASLHGVGDRRWLFLTGEKPSLYSQARKGYLLSADEGEGDAEDFVHTQNFALVDGERRIRGFYDGTDSMEVVRLAQDIRTLLEENAFRRTAH